MDKGIANKTTGAFMKFKPNEKSGGVAIEMGPEERQLPLQSARNENAALSLFHVRKILLPVDFSECSKKAVIYAEAFAKQFDAELMLLHVVQPYPMVPEMAPVDMDLMGWPDAIGSVATHNWRLCAG
jgi:hypothetical protein